MPVPPPVIKILFPAGFISNRVIYISYANTQN
jgi:hypothetical protein